VSPVDSANITNRQGIIIGYQFGCSIY